MSEEPEEKGLIIGGVVLVAVGFLCVGLVAAGYLFSEAPHDRHILWLLLNLSAAQLILLSKTLTNQNL